MRTTRLVIAEVETMASDLSQDVASLLNVQKVEHVLGSVLVYELERLDALLMDYFEAEASE